MPNPLSSPNMLIVYDFSDMVGQYRAVAELVVDNANYPKG